jgi:hypothetical protein
MREERTEGAGTTSTGHAEGTHRPVLARHTDYDWARQRPTTAIIETVTEHTGREMTELESLYDQVPTDPLDALFAGATDRQRRDEVSVTLAFAGFEVTVRGSGVVTLRPAGGT